MPPEDQAAATTETPAEAPAATPDYLTQAHEYLAQQGRAPVPDEAPAAEDVVADEDTLADRVLRGEQISPPVVPSTTEDPSLLRLMEQDRSLRAEVAAFRAEQAAFAEERAQVQRYLDADKADSKLDKIKALGFKYDDLLVEMMNGPGAKPGPATEELAMLRTQLEEMKATQEAAEVTRVKAAQVAQERQHAEWHASTARIIAEGGEKWELLRSPILMQGKSASQEIVQLIKAHYVQTGGENGGTILTVQEAADRLETSLEKFVRKVASSNDASQKFAGILGLTGLPTEAVRISADRASGRTDPPPATPTISLASRTSAGGPPPRPRTAADYKRLAMLKFAARSE